jgi:hypothetical protein
MDMRFEGILTFHCQQQNILSLFNGVGHKKFVQLSAGITK